MPGPAAEPGADARVGADAGYGADTAAGAEPGPRNRAPARRSSGGPCGSSGTGGSRRWTAG